MDRSLISNLEINVLILDYSKDLKLEYKGLKYFDEIKNLTIEDKRNEFIKDLALNIKGNTMIAFRYINHGKILYDMISKNVHKNRKVFFIAGETKTEIREDIRQITEKETDAILIASMKVFGTGINIRNLHNLIFASPVKSAITVLQTIGRSLRKPDNNQPARLYDIVDDLKYKSSKNFSLMHGEARNEIYIKENFNVTNTRIKL